MRVPGHALAVAPRPSQQPGQTRVILLGNFGAHRVGGAVRTGSPGRYTAYQTRRWIKMVTYAPWLVAAAVRGRDAEALYSASETPLSCPAAPPTRWRHGGAARGRRGLALGRVCAARLRSVAPRREQFPPRPQKPALRSPPSAMAMSCGCGATRVRSPLLGHGSAMRCPAAG